jgi:hypothetical protein
LLPIISWAQYGNWTFIVDNSLIGYDDCSNSKIILEYLDFKRDTINIEIIPGEILFLGFDPRYLTKQAHKNNTRKIWVEFDYSGYCHKGKPQHYELHFDINIFINLQYYMVFRIYNTDKKENKRVYIPLPGKNYNYTIDCNRCGIDFPLRIIKKRPAKYWKYEKR